MNDSVSKIWDSSLKDIKQSIPEHTYQAWFKSLQPVSFDNGIFKINVPNTFHFEWLETNYKDMIVNALKKQVNDDIRLQFLIKKIEKDDANDQNEDENNLPNNSNISQTKNFFPPGNEYSDRNKCIQLNNRYTFDNFVEGPNNQFSKVASRAVAESPGNTAFNPLLIYGGTGLGKTHLLQAIGNMVISNDPSKMVIYVSSEKFTVDFISAIRKNKMNEFGDIYRKADVLLVDDIQFFESKESTQEQFFHTFNELYQKGKQIVITADRTPKELHAIEERLVSRFLSGLMVDIQPPDYESRIAILQKKANIDDLLIPEEILDFIAKNITSNVRELEGTMTRIFAYSSLTHTDITLALAKKVIGDILSIKKNNVISFEAILKTVAEYYNLSENEIIGKSRVKEIAFARQIVMYLSRKLSGSSLKTIGMKLGGRDHTTVIHGHNVINQKIKKEKKFKKDIDTIKNQIDFELY
ncbi:MAG: chromosomal replication initiator protein DnaA [Candidatus Marinimicrobia bacterium]|nr:chromosomal replication initiator protein DnaA [Candidatus Neomarinimicrobiota bacterium]